MDGQDGKVEPTPLQLEGNVNLVELTKPEGQQSAIKTAVNDGKSVADQIGLTADQVKPGEQQVADPKKVEDPAKTDPEAKVEDPTKTNPNPTVEDPAKANPDAKVDDPSKRAPGDAPTPTQVDDDSSKRAPGDAPTQKDDDSSKRAPGDLPTPPQVDGDVPNDPTDANKLRPELQKELDEKLAAFKAEIDSKNFTIKIGRGEGPCPAMERMQKEIKAKGGKDLSAAEAELANMNPEQTLAEARRIRDRDFQVFKDSNGNPRNWYIQREETNRWSEAEVKDLVAAKEKELRADAEKLQKELEEKEKATPSGPSIKEEGTNFYDPKFNELPKEGEQAQQQKADGPWAEIVREQTGNFFDKRANELPEADSTKTGPDGKPLADSANPLVPEVTLVDPKQAGDQRKDVEEQAVSPGSTADSPQFPSAFLAYKAFDAGGLAGEHWNATNDAQKYIADALKDPATKAELASVPAGILDGKSSVGDAKPVNEFLQSKGLSFQIRDLGQGEMAFAGTLGLEGAWEGKEDTVKVGDKDVPGVVLRQESYKVGDQTVVKLYTKDGVTVYAMPLPEPVNGQQALQTAQQFTPKADSQRTEFNEVKLPMVSLDQTSSLDQLVGMTSQEGTRISEAKMQTKIALDQNGFSVKQGLAAIASRGIQPEAKQFVIDKPFLLWAVHEGGNGKPLFAVRADESTFKDPKQAK